MPTETQKLFLRMVTSLFQVQQSVADLFFKNRLDEEIEKTIERYIQYRTHPSDESRRGYMEILKELDKILQELVYLGKGDSVELAVSREQVLRCLSSFIQEVRVGKEAPIKNKGIIKLLEPITPPEVPSSRTVQKPIRDKKASKLSENQEKILDFVRREPDCRTKDVVSQFSALSERTVKRGLKELSNEGKIIKRSEGVAVYYSVA